MEQTPELKAQELAEKIAARRTQDNHWGVQCFIIAQIFLWLAIMASFGAAIASATGSVSPIIIAVLAAIPGTVIVIDRSFSFARRSSWHHLMRARLEQLENALRYEGASVESVSKALGELFLEMEPRYPGASVEGLTEFGRETK
jgi:hypothetical protein